MDYYIVNKGINFSKFSLISNKKITNIFKLIYPYLTSNITF